MMNNMEQKNRKILQGHYKSPTFVRDLYIVRVRESEIDVSRALWRALSSALLCVSAELE